MYSFFLQSSPAYSGTKGLRKKKAPQPQAASRADAQQSPLLSQITNSNKPKLDIPTNIGTN